MKEMNRNKGLRSVSRKRKKFSKRFVLKGARALTAMGSGDIS